MIETLPIGAKPAGPDQSEQSLPLLRLGFRPFYLLAALFAASSVPVWLAHLWGWMGSPAALPGMLWHAHEMVFGFAGAVIVGFLFTAGHNWTGLRTPTGWKLAALALLWVAGRVALFAAPGAAAAIIDAAFLPLAAAAMAAVIVRSANWRNLFVVAVLLALAAANVHFHLAYLGYLAAEPMQGVYFALLLIVLLECVIGGRVIPMFTANAIPGLRQVRSAQLDALAIGFTGAAFAVWLTGHGGLICLLTAAAAAALQAARLWGWAPLATLRHPILWILHLSYAWIPAGLLLLGLSAVGAVPAVAAFHAFAIGATGGLIIGMITRTALGHTGRALVAGPAETCAYAFVQLAALLRVIPLLVMPAAHAIALAVSGVLWSAAFALYLWKYAPYLLRPRADGKAG